MSFRNFALLLGAILFWGTIVYAKHAQTRAAEVAAPSSSGLRSGEISGLRLVKFNGVARDQRGQPLVEPVGITFAVYQDQEGGAPLWLETQNVQLDPQGNYSVLLGATTGEGVPLDLFASNEARWLGVRVLIPGAEEQPRLLFVSVPYAVKAVDADTLGGKPASAFLLADSGEKTNSTGPANVGGKSSEGSSIDSVAADANGSAGYLSKFLDNTNLVNSIIFENSGKIGVGTANPNYLTQIHAATGHSLLQLTNATTGSAATDGAYFGVLNGDKVFRIYNLEDANIEFFTNNQQRMVVGATGNIGIGTAGPTQKLDVAGTVKASGQLISTVATGTAPLVVDSKTQVANLNADLLGGMSAIAARTCGIVYMAGCDTCSVLTNADSQKTIYVNVIGPMTIESVTCFADAGSPTINIQRDDGSPVNMLSSSLTCSGTPTTSFVAGENKLNPDHKLDFVMVTAGGTAKRATVVIKATVDQQ